MSAVAGGMFFACPIPSGVVRLFATRDVHI